MTIRLVLLSMLLFTNVTASAANPSHYTPREIFKNWALSGCMSKGLHSSDAEHAAGAYVEFGTAPIEAYEKGTEMIERYLKKDYVAQDGSALHTMECIDLFHSKELDALARKYHH